MYKYYEKSGYDVMAYDFSSITEFIDYLDTHRVRLVYLGLILLVNKVIMNLPKLDHCKKRKTCVDLVIIKILINWLN